MKLIILSFLVLSLLLGISYAFYFQNLKPYAVGDKLDAKVTLLADTRTSGFYQTFKVDGLTIETVKDPHYGYGDKLSILGTIEENSFQSQGKTVKLLVVKNPKISKLVNSNILITTAAYFRNRIQTTFSNYLPHNESALLFGIVFGGSSGFSPDLYKQFQAAGVLHVIAASGMNVSIFAGFLFTFFALFFNRRQATILSIMGIFYYALISGFSASVVRAAIMGGIVFSAALYGRRSMVIISLLMTIFVMLFVSPGILFDVGFQLSVTATFGIILIKPLFDNIGWINKTEAVSDDITTSISAQLGSVPIMVSSFSTYSFISILVNALVLWTIPFLMILGGIAALCAITLPIISVIFLYLSYPLLLYFEKIVSIFGSVSLLQIQNVPTIFWIGYYSILFSLILFVGKFKRQKSK